MAKIHSTYRHPQHDNIARLIHEGASNNSIATALGVDRRAVVRVRDILGVAPIDGTTARATSQAAKLARFSTSLPDGHTGWTGRRNKSGEAPVIRHGGVTIPAAAVAFEQRTGRAPVGYCKADCGVPYCLTPEHIMDDIERRQVRLQLRALYGLDDPWDSCSQGHSWGEYGRVQPDLKLYCQACGNERRQRNLAAQRAEATTQ